MTSTTENALKEFLQGHASFTTQDLVRIVEQHQTERPSDAWLRAWGANHRVIKLTGAERVSKFKWVEADWRQQERLFGNMEDLMADPRTEWPDALKFAGCSYDQDATAVAATQPCSSQRWPS